ncbi:hypothetical protein BU24DRAFT_419841 [Aaosphaeria arxii CBS 175.79]|uniref:Uncharacterized protein n=1 Tax=Aaosphaeria arxii CBS 175.79 TaxID=1450172 RepID=A0A6A5Y5I8_9PLEO|nr:uncharacterized protein BU24DRAFT_419841 [Aaosphaeria arxii CBS 175.79]KAF2020297.1 hypothetical protein BU24DRAFT_419841 [Aaosphaeria arxii CBS 175.79]
MVIFGGLEFVVGGYLVHRHYKNKNEQKKRSQVQYGQQHRQNTYPGAIQQAQPPQQQAIPPQQLKYACHGVQQQPQVRPVPQQRPYTTQALPIQSRPYPQHPSNAAQFQPQIQPLSRADSFATISHMPVANGLTQPEFIPPLPTRPQHLNSTHRHGHANMPQQQHPVYNNAHFSASTPAFYHPSNDGIQRQEPRPGRATVDDASEAFGSSSSTHYSESTFLGERDDPPPPYRP